MQIEVNSDNNIWAGTELSERVESIVNHAMKRFEDRITRVEVHLSEGNSAASGSADKRCLIEARPAGHEPVAVTDEAADLDEAVKGAAGKLARKLDSLFGRLEDRH